MPLDLTVKKDFVLVELQERADFREIQRGIARIFYVPEVPHKNDIWVFHKGFGKFTRDDLYKLRDILEEIHPKDSHEHKTALVVKSGVQSSMAEEFTQITEVQHHEFKVFSSLKDAETWMTDS